MKISKHHLRPTHIYCDDTQYFITASIYQHRKLLDADDKTYLQTLLQSTFKEYQWRLDHWVILDNHYHLLCKSKKGQDLPKILGKIHSLISKKIKTKRKIEGKIWSNYWDYCPRDDHEYYTRCCYLLNNPYKHGYVEDLHDWQWSSFHEYYKKQGREKLEEMFKEYKDYRKLLLE